MTSLEQENIAIKRKIKYLKVQIVQLEKNIRIYKENTSKLEKALEHLNNGGSSLKSWLDNIQGKLYRFNASEDSNFSKYCKLNVDRIIKSGNIFEIIDETDVKKKEIKRKILEFEKKIFQSKEKILMLKNEIKIYEQKLYSNVKMYEREDGN